MAKKGRNIPEIKSEFLVFGIRNSVIDLFLPSAF